MYECVKVTDRCYFMDCPSRVGFILTGEGNDVIAIDSGSGKDAGKKILRIIEEQGWHLTAVYPTHGHADHMGGCHVLQMRTGCEVFMPRAEIAMADVPAINAALVYGGFPGKELQHKFMLAEGCDARRLAEATLPVGVEPVPLYGHSPRMTGFRCDDGTVFLGDALNARKTLEKYPITYLWDIAEHVKTLESLLTLEGKKFICAHVEPMDDIVDLAQFNIETIFSISERIATLCVDPITEEALIQKVFDEFHIPTTAIQVVLVGQTVRSFLTWMCGEGWLVSRYEKAAHYLQMM